MPFLFNIHTPAKTFAVQHIYNESLFDLTARIAKKAGLSKEEISSLQQRKDGAGLVYECEGSRWALEDDDDFSILFSRFPPASTSSATIHLTPPHAHAHFSLPESNSNNKTKSSKGASALKQKSKSSHSKTEKSTSGNGPTEALKMKDYASGKGQAAGKEGRELGAAAAEKRADDQKADQDEKTGSGGADGANDKDDGPKPKARKEAAKKPLNTSGGAHHFPPASHSGNDHPLDEHGQKVETKPEPAKGWTNPKHAHFAASIRSSKSRRSKWGDDDAEPLWEVKKREWHEFHQGRGVRTVLGQVGSVKDVRMLLIPGRRGVYISRQFAIENGLVPKQFGMGYAGYTGIKSIGLVPITVAGKTQKHQVLVNEEEHFSVVLGRAWVEKMNLKVDPIDETVLTYMDTGATIPCDIVVLKDKDGEKITIT